MKLQITLLLALASTSLVASTDNNYTQSKKNALKYRLGWVAHMKSVNASAEEYCKAHHILKETPLRDVHRDPGVIRKIAKFVNDGNPEHRHKFISRCYINDFDGDVYYDRGGWVRCADDTIEGVLKNHLECLQVEELKARKEWDDFAEIAGLPDSEHIDLD